jgi:hypothetical protein
MQALPQPPQLALLVCRSTHVPEQSVFPPAHSHDEFTHTFPAVHAVLQSPQWLVELVVSTHDAPHIVSAPVHTQLPSMHCFAAPHAVAQLPQWLLLVIRSTHAPLQFVGGFIQLVVQLPFWQTSLGPHAWWQAPQLVGSSARSAQVPASPPQLRSAGQVQRPPVHNSPLSQVAPSSTWPSQLLSRPSQISVVSAPF